MQVGSEVDRSREDALLVLTLRLTVELLPPLRHEVQLGLEVNHNLNLLATLIETVAECGILGCGVLVEGNLLATGFLHVLCAGNKFLDVETCACDRQQTHRCEHREASADIVGDDERGVAFLVGAGAGGAALGVSNGYDDLLGLLLAALGLTLLLEQAESQGSLGGGTRLGDVDDTELLAFQIFCQFEEVVLANVVACKQDGRVLLVLDEPAERIAQCLDDGTGSQITATDTGYYHSLTVLTKHVGASLQFVEECWRDAAGQMKPS